VVVTQHFLNLLVLQPFIFLKKNTNLVTAAFVLAVNASSFFIFIGHNFIVFILH
jgi:hypothetical protein